MPGTHGPIGEGNSIESVRGKWGGKELEITKIQNTLGYKDIRTPRTKRGVNRTVKRQPLIFQQEDYLTKE